MVIYTYLGKHLNIYWIKTFVQVFVVPMMNPNDFDVFFFVFFMDWQNVPTSKAKLTF